MRSDGNRVSIGKRLKYNTRSLSGWVLAALIIIMVLGIPSYTILWGIFGGPGSNWPHLLKYLLPDYLLNSLILVLGTTLLTLLFGVPSAWFASTFEFKGRRILEWMLILPLSIPTYIMAFTYAGIVDYTGLMQTILRNYFKVNLAGNLDILNIQGVILVLSLALFPYVYVICRAAFLTQYRSLIEASQVLGASAFRSFFKVILPVSRPALVAGVTLVIMEVLNDYGAVKYFGVRTFTTGIFRSWFSYEDPQAAIYLSSLLLLCVFAALLFEKFQRGAVGYQSTVVAERPLSRKTAKGLTAIGIIIACGLPAFLGFILPCLQLIWWAFESYGSVGFTNLDVMISHSFLLAATAALLCVAVAVVLLYAVQLRPSVLLKSGVRLSSMGYAIPGAVIAVGVLIPFLFIDKKLFAWMASWGYSNHKLILTGTVVGLLFAYVVRFLAVAFNPIESGFTRMGKPLHEVGSTLGASNWRLLSKVNVPLLKGVLLSAGLLVFIDVLKELPLTLILRPFNFNTLATRSFELASDELVSAAAVPSLIIILTGIIPIHLLNTLITKRKWT